MLRELLRGLEARQPQVVGNMTVIPLIAQETEYNKVGSVNDIYLDRDISYDTLVMASESNEPTIMPGGYTLVTKEAAQDRAVASKTLLPAKKKAVQVNAFCVQSSQPGHMQSRNRQMQKFRMLPATVRTAAYHNRHTRNYSALWQTLGAYNSSVGVGGDFLKSFFEKFQQQLDEFVAEFELVDHQRGAIIMINNKVYGIEISPNPIAWAAQWETLVRDCYGSEAVAKQAEFKTIDESALLGNVETLEDLAEKVNSLEQKEWDFAEGLVNEILGQTISTQTEIQREGTLKVVDIETGDYVGQVVRTNEQIIDLTFLKREAAMRGFKFRR